MDKTIIYALFNNKSRQFTAWMTDISSLPENLKKTMLLREVVLEDHGIIDAVFNPERYQWQGDYDTGKFTDLLADNKAIVTEKEVNEKYDALFFRKYEIKDIIFELIQNAVMITPKGKEIQDFFNILLQRKKDDVEYYKASDVHLYQTEEDLIRREKLAFQK